MKELFSKFLEVFFLTSAVVLSWSEYFYISHSDTKMQIRIICMNECLAFSKNWVILFVFINSNFILFKPYLPPPSPLTPPLTPLPLILNWWRHHRSTLPRRTYWNHRPAHGTLQVQLENSSHSWYLGNKEHVWRLKKGSHSWERLSTHVAAALNKDAWCATDFKKLATKDTNCSKWIQ